MTTVERAERAQREQPEQRDRRAVVVTGASRGIGAAIARRLAQDGYGVVVNYAADAEGAERVVADIRAHRGRAVSVRADVADPAEVAQLFDRARQLGRLTALVNNAGVVGDEGRIDERGADELTRLMRVNVVGPMLCAKHAVREMSTARGGDGGCIVNIASVAARTGGLPGVVPYATTKGALVTFTHGLSNEVAAEGIRVNSVSPGVIATDLTATVPQARRAAVSSPIGRIGRPEEVAATVSWLISPAASFVTGSDITVSGGR